MYTLDIYTLDIWRFTEVAVFSAFIPLQLQFPVTWACSVLSPRVVTNTLCCSAAHLSVTAAPLQRILFM